MLSVRRDLDLGDRASGRGRNREAGALSLVRRWANFRLSHPALFSLRTPNPLQVARILREPMTADFIASSLGMALYRDFR